MTTGQMLLVGGAVVAGVYFLSRQSSPPPGAPLYTPPRAPAPPPAPTIGTRLISDASRSTGLPLNTLGQAAADAPLIVKAAEFPIAVTGYTYKLVTHPEDTVKSAYHTVASGVTAAGHWVESLF